MPNIHTADSNVRAEGFRPTIKLTKAELGQLHQAHAEESLYYDLANAYAPTPIQKRIKGLVRSIGPNDGGKEFAEAEAEIVKLDFLLRDRMVRSQLKAAARGKAEAARDRVSSLIERIWSEASAQATALGDSAEKQERDAAGEAGVVYVPSNVVAGYRRMAAELTGGPHKSVGATISKFGL